LWGEVVCWKTNVRALWQVSCRTQWYQYLSIRSGTMNIYTSLKDTKRREGILMIFEHLQTIYF
jgi:hypothetical protein